ncbi:response regulator [Compostimonas suwonensis]|nr:response regulator transcription factor [Compostimonas suwonensis]
MNLREALPLVIVEDHALFRSMLVVSLSAVEEFEVVAAVASTSEARRVILPGAVRVAVLDIGLQDGDGIELGVELRRRDPQLGILLLSAVNAMDVLAELPADVAHGWSYLSKTSTANVAALTRAIRATARGETVLDPTLVAASVAHPQSVLATLTARQYEILQLLAEGLSNGAMAQRLAISERSVHNHLTAVYAALGIDTDTGVNARVVAVLRFLADSRRP